MKVALKSTEQGESTEVELSNLVESILLRQHWKNLGQFVTPCMDEEVLNLLTRVLGTTRDELDIINSYNADYPEHDEEFLSSLVGVDSIVLASLDKLAGNYQRRKQLIEQGFTSLYVVKSATKVYTEYFIYTANMEGELKWIFKLEI